MSTVVRVVIFSIEDANQYLCLDADKDVPESNILEDEQPDECANRVFNDFIGVPCLKNELILSDVFCENGVCYINYSIIVPYKINIEQKRYTLMKIHDFLESGYTNERRRESVRKSVFKA